MAKYNVVMCCYGKVLVNVVTYVITGGGVCVCVCVVRSNRNLFTPHHTHTHTPNNEL